MNDCVQKPGLSKTLFSWRKCNSEYLYNYLLVVAAKNEENMAHACYKTEGARNPYGAKVLKKELTSVEIWLWAAYVHKSE